jgi:hypothetical protein
MCFSTSRQLRQAANRRLDSPEITLFAAGKHDCPQSSVHPKATSDVMPPSSSFAPLAHIAVSPETPQLSTAESPASEAVIAEDDELAGSEGHRNWDGGDLLRYWRVCAPRPPELPTGMEDICSGILNALYRRA